MTITRFAILCLALLFSSGAAAQQRDAEEIARLWLLRAYDGQFAALDALSTGPSPGRTRLETQIRNALRVRCLYVDDVTFSDFSSKDAAASIDATVAVRSGDGQPGDVIPLRFRLASTPAGWRVSAIELRDQALASELIAASGDERARLLAANEPRLTKNLARTIYQAAAQIIVRNEWRPAIPIARLALDVALLAGDRADESLAIGMLGIGARLDGRRDEALRLTRESVAIAESSGDPLAVTRGYLNLSKILFALDNDSPEIEPVLQRALAASARVDDPQVRPRALGGLADYATQRRDLLAVRRYTDEQLGLVDASSDPFGEMRAAATAVLARGYLDLGDLDLAMREADRSLALLRDPDSSQQPYIRELRGMTLRRLGRNAEARKDLDEALRLARIANNRSVIAPVLDENATMAAERGDLGEAECLLRESATISRAMGTVTAGALHRIVPALLAHGRTLHALRLALEEAQQAEGRTIDDFSNALAAAAMAYRALGMTDRAMAAIDEAIESSETFYERTGGTAIQKVRSSESINSVYELAADIALARGDAGAALLYIDRGRGRVLHELAENGRPNFDAETDRADLETRQQLERKMAALNVDLAHAAGANDAARAEEVRHRLDDARLDHEAFLSRLSARYDRRSSTRPHATSTAELMSRIPSGMVMLVYAVRGGEVHILTARRDAAGAAHLTSARTNIARGKLDERVASFAKLMRNGDLRYRDAARELYKLLVAPAERELAAGDVLCIIPDESLWEVPFAALIDRRGRFLIERNPIVYASSISVYLAFASPHPAATHRPESVLAVGNPAVDSDAAKQMSALYRGIDVGALPEAESEADAICAMYGTERCTTLKRRDATEERAKVEMRDRRILHFATHGVLDDRNPMYSRLLLARGDSEEDGSLEAWEIARLDLDADLVVLSACDTARGRIGNGEGVVGMAWSFFVAGAHSTVAAQWRVETSSTARLMIAFHRALLGTDAPLRKARALRAAQLELLKNPKTQHPFYWAPFVLLGDAS